MERNEAPLFICRMVYAEVVLHKSGGLDHHQNFEAYYDADGAGHSEAQDIPKWWLGKTNEAKATGHGARDR